jgi:hypothetical protein
MNELKHGNSAHGGPNPDGLDRVHPPYWKRAHHDWRFWIAAFLIFVAMFVYVMTVEFSLRAGRQPQQPLVSPVGQ